ncbi:hypothetical protein HanPI659440_Chr16g0628901 [Helianthus annuus]|nr:hypothetical protein HanPI659440_Chr16g0628901 [Helianthus annuus]
MSPFTTIFLFSIFILHHHRVTPFLSQPAHHLRSLCSFSKPHEKLAIFTVVVVVSGGWWCSVRVVVLLGGEEEKDMYMCVYIHRRKM